MTQTTLLGLGVLPVLVGLGFVFYGSAAPMMWEDGHPPTRLTSKRFYVPLFVGDVFLTFLLLLWANYFLASRSACPTFTGTVTRLHWTQVKSGWKTQFNLHGDDGTSHAVDVYGYIRSLKSGDRASATIRTYDGETLALHVLTGDRIGLQTQYHAHDLSATIIMTPFILAFGGFLLGAATGRIKSHPRPRNPMPLSPWLANAMSGSNAASHPGDQQKPQQ